MIVEIIAKIVRNINKLLSKLWLGMRMDLINNKLKNRILSKKLLV